MRRLVGGLVLSALVVSAPAGAQESFYGQKERERMPIWQRQSVTPLPKAQCGQAYVKALIECMDEKVWQITEGCRRTVKFSPGGKDLGWCLNGFLAPVEEGTTWSLCMQHAAEAEAKARR